MTEATNAHTFKISYDTDETSNHSIDAEMLGSSITNMARLLKNGDAIINQKEPDLTVEVKANSEGSFVVDKCDLSQLILH